MQGGGEGVWKPQSAEVGGRGGTVTFTRLVF